MVAHPFGVQGYLADALHHLLQQIGIPKLTDEFSEVEALEDLAHILREAFEKVCM